MQISSAGGASYGVAVANKMQASAKQEGKDTIKLIEASSQGSTQLPAGVGENLNVKA